MVWERSLSSLKKRGVPSPLWIALALLSFWIWGALAMPLIQDEAYYGVWAQHLAWGYFDHPPFVAWLGALVRFFPGEEWALRFGTLVTGLLTIAAAVDLFRTLGLKGRGPCAAALMLLYGNLLGLVFGFLSTPDTALMLFWALALGEGAKALKGQEKRWITAGLFTGLGLLAKYTMALIGPVFLWGLIRLKGPDDKKSGLKSPWPYVGGVVAFLVFSPHLWWNAQHDWITMRFQMRHGFSMERPENGEKASLPRPEKAPIDSPEYLLSKPFLALDKVEKRPEKPRTWLMTLGSACERVVGYYGSQLALWGACLLGIIPAFRRYRAAKKARQVAGGAPEERTASALLSLTWASAVVPLAVCGLLSISSKVEANWSAMYVFGASALMAPWVAREWGKLTWGVLINAFLGGLLILHGQSGGLLPLKPSQDRVLQETHGYQDLGETLEKRAKGLPIYTETYQLSAMLDFYAPHLKVSQWPGMTRDSEFVRNSDLHYVGEEALARVGEFWLVTTQIPPPRVFPYSAVEIIHLRDCKVEKLQVITSPIALGMGGSPCQAPIHKWYLVRYAKGPVS